jgi:hypothetical protein
VGSRRRSPLRVLDPRVLARIVRSTAHAGEGRVAGEGAGVAQRNPAAAQLVET